MRYRWAATVAAVAAGTLLLASPSALAVAPATSEPGWVLTAATVLPNAVADQGVTTVGLPGGGSRVVTRGAGNVPEALADAGWVHVGDPGASATSVVDAFQGSTGATAKLFTITTADGRRFAFVHRLLAGESYHNSFAAPTPDGRWILAGEWGTRTRLLVFGMPALTPAALAAPQPLPLATVITLTRPVRDVQGCAFADPTTVLCSTNDPGTSLYAVPRQLLQLRLDRPVDGHPQRATPRLLGAAPAQTICPGPGEVEGLDVSGGRLLLAINAVCQPVTELFTLTRTTADSDDLVPPVSWRIAVAQPVAAPETRRRTPASGAPASGSPHGAG